MPCYRRWVPIGSPLGYTQGTELDGVDRTPGSSAGKIRGDGTFNHERVGPASNSSSSSCYHLQGHDLNYHHNMWRRTEATSRRAEQQHTRYNPHGTTHQPKHDPVRPRNAGRTRSQGWHREQAHTGNHSHGSTPPTEYKSI